MCFHLFAVYINIPAGIVRDGREYEGLPICYGDFTLEMGISVFFDIHSATVKCVYCFCHRVVVNAVEVIIRFSGEICRILFQAKLGDYFCSLLEGADIQNTRGILEIFADELAVYIEIAGFLEVIGREVNIYIAVLRSCQREGNLCAVRCLVKGIVRRIVNLLIAVLVDILCRVGIADTHIAVFIIYSGADSLENIAAEACSREHFENHVILKFQSRYRSADIAEVCCEYTRADTVCYRQSLGILHGIYGIIALDIFIIFCPALGNGIYFRVESIVFRYHIFDPEQCIGKRCAADIICVVALRCIAEGIHKFDDGGIERGGGMCYAVEAESHRHIDRVSV